jgi:hypothetical protein
MVGLNGVETGSRRQEAGDRRLETGSSRNERGPALTLGPSMSFIVSFLRCLLPPASSFSYFSTRIRYFDGAQNRSLSVMVSVPFTIASRGFARSVNSSA